MGGPSTKFVAEDQIRGKRLELGGVFSREGDAAGTIWIHESVGGAKDAFFQVDGDTIIVGNLTVQGVLTSIESVIVEIADKNISLNFGGTDLTADGSGLTIDRPSLPLPSLIWSNAFGAWAAGFLSAEKEITTEGNTFNSADELVKLDAGAKIPIYSSQTYIHDQLVASSSWVISHTMQKRPSVTVVTSAGDVVYGDVNYVDDSNLTVSFAAAFSGKAYLN